MPFLKIILFCILAAGSYGIIHDQITARVCVEYFTIGHPPVFHTKSPTLLGIGWGILATWWVGVFLGVPLACVSQYGTGPKLTIEDLVRPIMLLLACMGVLAFGSGVTGNILASRGIVKIFAPLDTMLSPASQIGFLTDMWAHSASYLVGFVGGLILIFWAWKKRNKLRRVA